MVHHRRGLRRLLRDDALLDAIESDPFGCGLEPRRIAILRYAGKLTASPGSMVRADVEALRAVGLDDGSILGVAEVVAYYAYANRIVDGLGVQLESESIDAG